MRVGSRVNSSLAHASSMRLKPPSAAQISAMPEGRYASGTSSCASSTRKYLLRSGCSLMRARSIIANSTLFFTSS